MLQRIRDKSSGPIAYVIVGLIALVFSVFGIGSYFTQSANPAVAEVGDTEITQFELQRAYDQRYARLQQLMGENFNHDVIDPQQFRRSVLEGLIQQAMLSQYAQETGYRVTDQALLQALRTDPRFQIDGSFSAQRYRTLLAQAGISASRFEAGLRNDLRVRQLRQGVLGTAFVSHREVARAFALQNQRRRGAYLSYRPSANRDRVEISDAEVAAYYRNNPNAFMRPQRVKLDYVLLDRNALEVADMPDQAFLKTLYEQEKESRFKSPERRLARHILVRIDEDTDADAARKRIQELAERLKSSDTGFAELAESVSDDQATAGKGGKLDWVSRGTMVAPFEQALFRLELGEVSAPVKTEFGWHLIKLEKVDPAEIKPFDDPQVQRELLSLYRSRERRERFQQMAERLEALSFEAPESLKPIAEELGLKIRSSGWLTRKGGGEGVMDNQAVIDAAFSDSVLKDGLNSTPIQLSSDRQMVVRVADKQAAKRRPLEEMRGEIRQTLTAQAAARIASEQAARALEAARGGKRLASIAEAAPAQPVETGWVERGNGELPAALRDKLFALPHPSGDGASYGTVALPDGGAALVALRAVDTPEPAQQAGKQLRRQLRSRIAGLEYSAFRQSVRDGFDIKIYQDRLN